jgi:hypothetical protein
MKCVSIAEARRLANETGATRLLILSINDEGDFAFTTFGRTKGQCKALADWADRTAVEIAMQMDAAP